MDRDHRIKAPHHQWPICFGFPEVKRELGLSPKCKFVRDLIVSQSALLFVGFSPDYFQSLRTIHPSIHLFSRSFIPNLLIGGRNETHKILCLRNKLPLNFHPIFTGTINITITSLILILVHVPPLDTTRRHFAQGFSPLGRWLPGISMMMIILWPPTI